MLDGLVCGPVKRARLTLATDTMSLTDDLASCYASFIHPLDSYVDLENNVIELDTFRIIIPAGADLRPERRARRATERRGGLRPHVAEDCRR